MTAPSTLAVVLQQTTSQLKSPPRALSTSCLLVQQVRHHRTTAYPAVNQVELSRPRVQLNKFDKLVPALRAFHQAHKHWVVPLGRRMSPFVDAVHDDIEEDYEQVVNERSSSSRGFSLYAHLSQFLKAVKNSIGALESTVKELEDIGFPVHRCLEYGNDGLRQFRWEERTMPALETFKELHGDLFVERLFVVPDGDHRWPRCTWGYKLGKAVNRLRVSRLALPDYQREDLDRVGFIWDSREVRWNQYFMPALRHFKKIHGHCRVSQDFVVPANEPQELKKRWPEHLEGYRLGQTVIDVRRGKYASYVAATSAELQALKFVWNVEDDKWDNAILPALRHYFKLHGHSVVPQDFVVPSGGDNGWSEEVSGLRLGKIVNTIREGAYARQVEKSAAELADLEFSFAVYEDRWTKAILPALQHFHQLHNHSVVPKSFVVPSRGDDGWPKEASRLKLGYAVTTIRGGCFVQQVERSTAELAEIGFSFDVFEDRWFLRILPALQHFFRIHGHCYVPRSYVVPSADGTTWPRSVRGVKLGEFVNDIRGGHFASQVKRSGPELEAIEFAFNVWDTRWDRETLPALRHFFKLRGHCDVPKKFVVPEDFTSGWPEKSRGLKLGVKVSGITQGRFAFQVERSARELKELKLPPFEVSEKVWRAKILPALEAFVQQFGSDDPVSPDFVVPKEDPWPKQTWGFTLGNSMENIRHVTKLYEKHLKADEDKLRAMGAWCVLECIIDGGEDDKQG